MADIRKDMEAFQKIIEEGDISKILYKKTPHKEAVALLQRLLNYLGYGGYLNWEKYKDDGDYGFGTEKAVEAFIKDTFSEFDENTSDFSFISDLTAKAILKKVTEKLGGEETLSVSETKEGERDIISVILGNIGIKFSKFRKGLYTVGNQKPCDVINDKKEEFKAAGLNDSKINVITAVSRNEGNLDAVNTWDNSFLTFGMFQWTIGAGEDPGELPALLKKIKEKYPEVFQKYYGRHGLDITEAGSVTGFLSLNGKKISKPEDKDSFRNHDWAFYFWLSGQDFLIHSIQIEHAISRIDRFYHSNSYKVTDYYISDIITSEYGVALLLDNHVNRPGYVTQCLETALKEIGISDPASWGDKEENELIEAYLKVRKTYGKYPMTHSEERAKKIAEYRDNNVLSDRRGSFKA